MKVGYAQILGNPQSVIYGKNLQNLQFPVIYDSFDFLQFLGISQTVISGKKIQRLFFFNFHLSLVLLNDDVIYMASYQFLIDSWIDH